MVKRMRGSFELPDDELAEPARTERLLARPCALHHATASDAFTALSQTVIGRSSGGALVGMLYDWIALTVRHRLVPSLPSPLHALVLLN